MKETGIASGNKQPLLLKLESEALSKAKTKDDSANIYTLLSMLKNNEDSLQKDTAANKERKYGDKELISILEKVWKIINQYMRMIACKKHYPQKKKITGL